MPATGAVALAAGEEPVAAIAFAHGFGDLSTFVTSFGRVFGRSPRDYRRVVRRGGLAGDVSGKLV